MYRQFLLLFLLLSAATGLYAQVPQGINYQAVARDGDGTLLTDRTISLILTVRDPSRESPLYSEGHRVTTNAYGLFSVVLGQGAPRRAAAFTDIDWSKPQELGVVIDGEDLGFTPFQAVPYALATARREHVIGVPAAAFSPNNNSSDFLNSVGNGGVAIRGLAPGSTTTVLNAPVQLPHGAVVTEMRAYFIDESEAELRIWLAKELYTEAFNIVGSYTTTGSEPDIREAIVPLNVTINNLDGGYYLRVFCNDWTLAGRKLIKGISITYTY